MDRTPSTNIFMHAQLASLIPAKTPSEVQDPKRKLGPPSISCPVTSHSLACSNVIADEVLELESEGETGDKQQ
jgi:hypothetical protein